MNHQSGSDERAADDGGANALQVYRHSMGLEFKVYIELGDWWSHRYVLVTDATVDVADLLRRIARGETSVTAVEQSVGRIIYDGDGPQERIVGEWSTIESADVTELPMKCTFTLQTGADVPRDLSGADLAGLRIEVADDEAADG